MYRIKQNDLKVFKKLQLSPFELGGKIKLDKTSGVHSSYLTSGKTREIETSKFPTGILWFHTHPSKPFVKETESIHTKVLGQFKKRKNFTIDILVSPISDDDLLVVFHSVRVNRMCAMAVFCPEGIYIMYSGKKYEKKQSPSCLKSTEIEIKTINKPTKIKKRKYPKDCSVSEKERAKKFLKERDNYISDEMEVLVDKLKKGTEKSNILLLKKFQMKIGKRMEKIVKDIFPEVEIHYYSWNSKSIPITPLNCNLSD